MNAIRDRKMLRLRSGHAGKVRQGGDHAVSQLDIAFNSVEVFGFLLGRRIGRGLQEVDRSLDDVQGIAKFMGNTPGNLTQTSQAVDLLLARGRSV